MTDIGSTEPLSHTRPTDSDEPRRTSGDDRDLPPSGTHRPSRDPVEVVKSPDNRAKLLLGIAALSLLNLLLLAFLLSQVLGGPGEEVVIDGEPCLIAEHEGENRLYCAR